MTALLEVDAVSVSFDGFRAIDGLSLAVEATGLRAIIGPNGAGKTTFMDIVTGKTRPDRGRARRHPDTAHGSSRSASTSASRPAPGEKKLRWSQATRRTRGAGDRPGGRCSALGTDTARSLGSPRKASATARSSSPCTTSRSTSRPTATAARPGPPGCR